jgi:hypothetical protein
MSRLAGVTPTTPTSLQKQHSAIYREVERRFSQALLIRGPESTEARQTLEALEALERDMGIRHTLGADELRCQIARAGYVVQLTRYTVRDDWGCPEVEYSACAGQITCDQTGWPDIELVAHVVGASRFEAYQALAELLRAKGLM